MDYLESPMPETDKLRDYEASSERNTMLASKKKTALKNMSEIKKRWRYILSNLEKPALKTDKLLSAVKKRKSKKPIA